MGSTGSRRGRFGERKFSDSVDLTVELPTHPIPSQEDAEQKLSPTGLRDRKRSSVWWENIAVSLTTEAGFPAPAPRLLNLLEHGSVL